MRSSRKRRRASSSSVVPLENHQNESAPRTSKEADIWDAFREEYVESVEQLPLSIHRNFALLNEIDAQSNVLESTVPLNIREYLRRRQIAMGLAVREGNILSLTNDANIAKDHTNLLCANRLLSEIAVHINELLHVAEEKVNLAQATYDAIDRHVRLLDQTIREHDTQPNNDLTVATNNSPPFPVSGLLMTRLKDNADGPGFAYSPNSQRRAEKTLQSQVGGRLRRLPKARTSSVANSVVLNNNWSGDGQSIEQAKAADMPIDPNEPRYCYCGQVSWGEMIGCDATGCEREWFHLGCVGLTEAPKRGKWYCDACREKNLLGSRRRGQ